MNYNLYKYKIVAFSLLLSFLSSFWSESLYAILEGENQVKTKKKVMVSDGDGEVGGSVPDVNGLVETLNKINEDERAERAIKEKEGRELLERFLISLRISSGKSAVQPEKNRVRSFVLQPLIDDLLSCDPENSQKLKPALVPTKANNETWVQQKLDEIGGNEKEYDLDAVLDEMFIEENLDELLCDDYDSLYESARKEKIQKEYKNIVEISHGLLKEKKYDAGAMSQVFKLLETQLACSDLGLEKKAVLFSEVVLLLRSISESDNVPNKKCVVQKGFSMFQAVLNNLSLEEKTHCVGHCYRHERKDALLMTCEEEDYELVQALFEQIAFKEFKAELRNMVARSGQQELFFGSLEDEEAGGQKKQASTVIVEDEDEEDVDEVDTGELLNFKEVLIEYHNAKKAKERAELQARKKALAVKEAAEAEAQAEAQAAARAAKEEEEKKIAELQEAERKAADAKAQQLARLKEKNEKDAARIAEAKKIKPVKPSNQERHFGEMLRVVQVVDRIVPPEARSKKIIDANNCQPNKEGFIAETLIKILELPSLDSTVNHLMPSDHNWSEEEAKKAFKNVSERLSVDMRNAAKNNMDVMQDLLNMRSYPFSFLYDESEKPCSPLLRALIKPEDKGANFGFAAQATYDTNVGVPFLVYKTCNQVRRLSEEKKIAFAKEVFGYREFDKVKQSMPECGQMGIRVIDRTKLPKQYVLGHSRIIFRGRVKHTEDISVSYFVHTSRQFTNGTFNKGYYLKLEDKSTGHEQVIPCHEGSTSSYLSRTLGAPVALDRAGCCKLHSENNRAK